MDPSEKYQVEEKNVSEMTNYIVPQNNCDKDKIKAMLKMLVLPNLTLLKTAKNINSVNIKEHMSRNMTLQDRDQFSELFSEGRAIQKWLIRIKRKTNARYDEEHWGSVVLWKYIGCFTATT